MSLPGNEAHIKMVPAERLQRLPDTNTAYKNAREAAVLCCFYPNLNNEVYFVLTMRHSYNGVHSNQISFPGGKPEASDTDLIATALRETQEEVGLNPAGIQVVKPLSKVFIPPSNFLVQPFIGYTNTAPVFTVDEKEVAVLIEVSLDDLMQEGSVGALKMNTSYAENIEVPAFIFNNFVVWGATAMMLSEVKHLFNLAK